MHRLPAVLITALLACGVHAQPRPAGPEIAAGVVTVDRYPVREVVFPNGVRSLPAQVYSQPVGFRPLTLDLYLPPATQRRPAAGFPLVLYIHGGDWLRGDPRRNGAIADFPSVLASLAGRGYVVASMAYRLAGEARFPAQAEDVAAALRWLRQQSGRHGIDPARSLTWGVGAGGQLASLVALACNTPAAVPDAALLAAPSPMPTPPSPLATNCVQAAVAWHGIFDLATLAEQARAGGPAAPESAVRALGQLLGCEPAECRPERLAAASPVTHVDAADPPLLLIAGSADTTIPHQQTLEMAQRLEAQRVPHQLVVMPGLDHHLIGKTPAHTREANQEALDATFRFIDRTIGGRR